MLRLSSTIYAFLCFYPVYSSCSVKDTIRKTNYGPVRGTTMLSLSGRCFQAYRGIPYAKPPVENLRFRPPLKPTPWHDVFNATQDAPQCIQQNIFIYKNPNVEGSEDCLYLNVYAPKLLDNDSENDLLPVMVYIHYGGFLSGTGRSDYHGPEYFMDKDLILVTFNYRLGVLGFLSTYDDAAPGNWGLKDQVELLRWVQENIIYFGGNPKQVTIFGQSAGGGSTHYHMLSPLSKGLFHAAISQSGSALAIWATPQRELSAVIAKTQAFFVGCRNDTDSFTMVDCLRKVSAYDLTVSSNLFRYMWSEPLIIYMPSIEIRTELNPEPFITEEPLEIIKKGQFHNVPWIVGLVADEGIFRATPFVHQPDILETINKNLDNMFPNMIGLSVSTPKENLPAVWKSVKKLYFPKNVVNVSDPETIKGFIDIYSDRYFFYPSYRSALLHAWKGHEKIWFYVFDYRGNYTYGDLFKISNDTVNYDWGVCHCDDLLYLFSGKYAPQLVANDKKMSEKMITLFTNFAIYGNPTPNNLLDNDFVEWDNLPNITGKKRTDNSDLHYLSISGNYNLEQIYFEMKNNFYPNRMSLWENLPLYENRYDLY